MWKSTGPIRETQEVFWVGEYRQPYDGKKNSSPGEMLDFDQPKG